MIAYSLSDAEKWFLENHEGALLCQNAFTEKECSSYVEAKEFFNPKVRIGVVTPTEPLYRQWILHEGVPKYGTNAIFIKIRNLDSVRGRNFDVVEKGYMWVEVDQEVYDAALLRVKQAPTP